ncbi:P-loop NTPase fold protein [Hymenobacter cellulosivorans]|uniref:P-loop NTPase fold protein n=1 Tax=Hymenobacter cellulosivorans TaxID=2932249 RepID=A0ABY4FAC4_9BACT|nr:P-loop NTPase fold protein [Hymenobacter cellulosivorans]UOQ53052.1 P-loop NTPase fold protein [Hymenobacter cellulosivorans]
MSLDISVSGQNELFEKHLKEDKNERIIFSGAFGIGKTYFLENFFTPSQSDYLAIKLSPVNYSISSNEDIFKLIKYDILFELASKHGLTLEGEPVSWDVALGTLLPSRAASIIQSFLPLIPLLNKDMESIPVVLTALTSWVTIADGISKQKSAAAKETKVIDFGEQIAAMYNLESDYITTFLENSLTTLAQEKKAKYKVLIIDDLDRIDPEHIFRLFNIFSAHLDYHKISSNKFGFDRVIFVCDIHNIRNIFHSRYGTDTDFTGYIDKFFSKEIFFFNNEAEISNYVDHIIAGFNFEKDPGAYFQQRILQGRNYNEQGLLHIIFKELILSGGLKMRRLKESYANNFYIPSKILKVSSPESGTEDIPYRNLPALVTIEILSRILGGGFALSKAIKTAVKYKKSIEYQTANSRQTNWLVGMLLPVLDYSNHQFSVLYNPEIVYGYNHTSGIHIPYTITIANSHSHDRYYFAHTQPGTKGSLDFLFLLDLTVDSLLQQNILR